MIGQFLSIYKSHNKFVNKGQHICSLEILNKNSKILFFERLYLLDVSIFEDTIFKSEKLII